MKHVYILLVLSLSLVSLALAKYTTPWTLLKPSGRTPEAREFHASIYNNGVWIYGGMSNQTQTGLQLFCDLQHYDVSANKWTLVDNCTQSKDYNGPGKLYDSAYAQWRDCFLIFGGTNDKGARITDTWCYNFTAGHWSELVVKFDEFQKSYLQQTGLSAVVYQDNFIISSNQAIFVLNLTAEPKTWSKVSTDDHNSQMFVAANNYAMTLEESTGRVWMYAGNDAAGNAMSWVNWIMTSNWTYVTPTIYAGLPPLSRSKSAFSDGGEYFLWGGYDGQKVTFGKIDRYPNTTYKFINDSQTGLIWAVAPAVNNPRGRVGHSLVRSESNEIYVFGGRTDFELSGMAITYDELWTVSMATQLSVDVTTAECHAPSSSFVDEPFQCLIVGRDVDGRVTGDSSMAKNFKVVVTNSGNSTINSTEVMYFGSAFHFAFRVSTTGEYKVSITYLEDELPKASSLSVNAECPSMYWGSSCSVYGWWVIGPAIAVVVLVAIIVTVVVVRKRKAGYQPLN